MDFEAVRQKADGMLPIAVYEALYRCALSADSGSLVEVGGAHGAATIALARGVRDAGRADRVYTFETGAAMTAPAFQRPAEANLRILRDNLEAFGVSDSVNVIPHHVNKAEAKAVLAGKPISLLLLDADGVLDRDFGLFYNALLPGAPIIIDDYQNKVELEGVEGTPLGKHEATFRYVNYFVEKGLLVRSEVLGRTFFGKKPETMDGAVCFDRAELQAVRDRMAEEKSRLDALISAARAELAADPDLSPHGETPIPSLAPIPSMTNARVLRHLYECCRRHRGVGEVVEVGSWLGASAAYMAAGLREAGARATLHCFDAWRATEYEVLRAAGKDGYVSPSEVPVRLSVGQDLAALFLNNVIPVYPRVKATKTDIKDIKWNGRLVELLHDDGSKYDQEFRHVLRTFGPAFIPGVTLLVLSDYNYWKLPHCPDEKREELRAQTTLMETLGDHFNIVFDSEVASAVTFLYTKAFDFTRL